MVQTEIIPQSSQLVLSPQEQVDPEAPKPPPRFQAGATLVEQLQKLQQSRPSSPLPSTLPTTSRAPSPYDEIFLASPLLENSHLPSTNLVGEGDLPCLSNYGFLGRTTSGDSIYLNTQAPFCLVALGVQGAGKSHSVATVIENCMLRSDDYIRSDRPTSTIVFHYDQSEYNFCEAVTLTSRRFSLPSFVSPVPHLTVLVSPSFYLQRQEFYKGYQNCTVVPLLFRWSDLNATQIKSLMRVIDDDSVPLYMSTLLDLLRKIQKSQQFPSYLEFKEKLTQLSFSSGQNGPLSQRIRLLESFIADSEENQSLPCVPLQETLSNAMVVVDLTDPMLSASEANGIFQVLLSLFISIPSDHPKLAVFDEAHKYLQNSTKDELSSTIVSIVRQMRHNGVRTVISTQSPNTIPAELLELVSITLIHRFHSMDWFGYLKQKLPLTNDLFPRIMGLPTGTALVVSGGWSPRFIRCPGDRAIDDYTHEVQIRPRLTADAGVSRC